MAIKVHLIRIFWRLAMRPHARLTRSMTLGSRVVVVDAADRVLLVKQTYSPYWILPGGGVERGETLAAAAARELLEEAGIVPAENMQLLGIYSNHRAFPGDHVACFVLRQFRQLAWSPDSEIEDAQFFAWADLPIKTNPGSRQRIAEVLHRADPGQHWS
jgi:8-oxo-dGTP pyrophosphatase MutT (NUDIX family)